MTTLTAAPLLALQIQRLYTRDPSMFEVAGVNAGRLQTLGWVMATTGTIVFLIVMGLLLWPLWRSRHAAPIDGPPAPARERLWVLVGGTLVPALILASIFVFTLSTAQATTPPPRDPLTIEVIGHQWWWEVRYPGDTVELANEMHVPVGQPVRVLLRSADVLHSFWVPNLAGKTDLITGVTNTRWIQADEPGVWRGECAEYCGMQHAHMAFVVIAEPEGEYARWIESQRATAHQPADSATLLGERTFLSSSCGYCHTVRGTPAGGTAGPDLTHIASRYTLGGTLENTRGNLAGWIQNPDRMKPGVKMPAVPMSGPELQALVGYLESLK